MPIGPENDPAFQPIGRWAEVDVARWGTEGGDYSDDRRYRWSFRRRWGPGGSVCWVGLNPGTGDSDGKPRPTLRKMVAWTQRWGGGEIVIVNLFAFRTTNPKELYTAARDGIDIVGDRNDEAIRTATADAFRTAAAWGAHGRLLDRGAAVAGLVPRPVCLGVTRRGEPRHPLYVALATEPIAYRRTL
jgi:hypothetical protein